MAPRPAARPGDPPDRPAGTAALLALLRRPQVLLPAGVVVFMLLIGVVIQPGGASQPAQPASALSIARSTVTATPSTAPTGTPTAAAKTPAATAQGQPPASATSDVAGVRATATTDAASEPDLTRQATQCGSIQEVTTPVSIEQALLGVSVRVTRATVYPIAYFRCILMATGGRESIALASSLGKLETSGQTHAVVIDLWVANGGKEFGQVNLKTASIAAAGASFSPLATLGGRGEVVVSTGEGRAVALVVALKNTVGTNTGPMTLSIDAPLICGKQQPGKFQLFLPTP